MLKIRIFPSMLCAAFLMVACSESVTNESDAAVEPAFSAKPPVVRSDAILTIPFFVVDGAGAPIDPASTPASTVLYDARAYAAWGELVPVTAPSGQQVTWGEFTRVKGDITASCNERGTHVVLHLSNLIPKGVYTVWNVTFDETGFSVPHPLTLNTSWIGVGPSGPSDGSRNTFTASASGRASISTITPPGPLGVFGQIGACALTDEYEWHVAGLYHMDGLSHGSDLGPIGSMAEHFAFMVTTAQ
jgi:hypothetical protein